MILLRSPSAIHRATILIVGLLLAMAGNAGESPKRIRIIHTNDMLGWLAPCG